MAKKLTSTASTGRKSKRVAGGRGYVRSARMFGVVRGADATVMLVLLTTHALPRRLFRTKTFVVLVALHAYRKG